MAAGVTPARSGAASVSATPLRDALRINDAKFSDAPLDARDAKRRAAATRDELREGLASLPAPAVDLVVMSKGVCALLTDRSIYCFGGRFGRLHDEKGGARVVLPFEGLDPWVNAPEYEPVVDFPLTPPPVGAE